MKSPILATAVVVVLMLAAFASTNATTSERPPGVAAEEWIAINDKIGFVIVPNRNQPAQIAPSQALLLTPSKAGYFVVKGAAGWTRLVVVEPVKGPGAVG